MYLRKNMVTPLLNAFREKHLYKKSEIADAASVDRSTCERFFGAETDTTTEPLGRIFACRLGFINSAIDGTIDKDVPITSVITDSEKLRAINEEIEQYCEDAAERVPAIQTLPKMIQTPPETNVAPIECMTVYAKLLHLTDKKRCQPAYIKFIPRHRKQFKIYDEIILIRSILFNTVPNEWTTQGHRKGIVDLQMLYPSWLFIDEHTNNRGPEDENDGQYEVYGDDEAELDGPSLDTVEHLELEPTRLIQSIHPMYNCFQRKQEYVGSVIRANCARLILVADLTSLPIDSATLFTGPAVGELVRPMRGGKKQIMNMDVQQATTGMFILDSKNRYEGEPRRGHESWNPDEHKVTLNDKYYIRFSIDWDEVAKAGGWKP